MNIFKKVLIIFAVAFLSSAYAVVKTPSALNQIRDTAVKQYIASQKLQQVVHTSAHQLSAKWVEVFDQKGLLIASSNPSKLYQHQTPKQLHYNAVLNVLRSGRFVTLKGSGTTQEKFYPIKVNRKTIGVIEVVH